MPLIHSSAQIFNDRLLSFSAYEWNLLFGGFEFVAAADNMYLEFESFELNL